MPVQTCSPSQSAGGAAVTDFETQVTWSSKAFLDLVWPVIHEPLGGGQLIPVEAVTKEEMRRHLDRLAGIDAWQICGGRSGMRGIASRVQRGKAYNTFTIRYALAHGGETEWAKRLRAIEQADEGWLSPYWTCQAYISEDKQDEPAALLACAVVRTRHLIGYVKAALESNDRSKVYPQTNRYDGNEFLVVNWQGLALAGLLPLYLVPEQVTEGAPETYWNGSCYERIPF